MIPPNFNIYQMALVAFSLSLTGCEYGDSHGTPESADVILGLKERPIEIYSFRTGGRDFTGYFVSDFPATSASYFITPPKSFLNHPRPLSYQTGHTLVKWRKTPVDPADKFLLDRALSVMRANSLPTTQIEEFAKRSESKEAYYAALFETFGRGKYGNITFSLLDPKTRRLRQLTDTSSF